MTKTPKKTDRRDAPHLLSGLIGLVVFVGAALMWPAAAVIDLQSDYVLLLLLTAISMILAEVLLRGTALWVAAGLTSRNRAFSLPREKLVGMTATFALVLGSFHFFPLYSHAPFAAGRDLFVAWSPWLFVVSLVYVVAVDHWMTTREDDLFAFGQFVMTLGRAGDRHEVRQFLLGIVIKIFFAPMLFGFGQEDWAFFRESDLPLVDWLGAYDFLFRGMFFCDASFATLGYCMAWRVLNGHIRWVDRTLTGWLVCILCYTPFWNVIGRELIAYDDGYTWISLTGVGSPLTVIWSGLILACVAVFLAATLAFGLRFSNLTYRGTIRHGPYRYIKHPAYVSKCVSYFLIQIPILNADPVVALKSTLAFTALCGIYVARAWHEEHSLSQDHAYVAYQRWIRRYGLVRRITLITRLSPIRKTRTAARS